MTYNDLPRGRRPFAPDPQSHAGRGEAEDAAFALAAGGDMLAFSGIRPRAGITGTGGDDFIEGTPGNDLIEGLGGDDEIYGYDGDDRLEGGDGADYLEGGSGSDLLYGGAGNDSLVEYAGFPGDAQLYGEDGNDDLLVTWSSGTVACSVLLDGGNDNDSLYFSAGSRFIDQATLIGGAGNDYIYTRAGLNVSIDAGTGADRVELGHGATNYTVTLGAGADLLTIIYYNALPALPNVVVTDFETGDAGDRLQDLTAYLDLVLANWDHATNPFATGHLQLVQSGADAILRIDRDGAGGAHAFVNLVTFQNATAAAFTTLNLGHVPPDGSKPAGLTITATSVAETIHGTLGDDVLRGATYATFGFDYGGDYIYGYGGDDDLAGGTGGDRLYGGVGNDTYHVEDAADLIFEAAGAGTDLVYASASYALAAGSSVEILSTTQNSGTGAIDLIGNEFDNIIYGNAGANLLAGGGGADVMVGFGGDDVYLVDHPGDGAYESAGEGTDIVYTSVSYTLAAGSSIELLSAASNGSTDAIDLTGNGFANTIYGNNGVNTLRGGGGSGDKLIGLGGNDTYIVQGDEQVFEASGGGTDVVYTSVSYALEAGSHVEILSTTSNAGIGAIDLTGNELANTIYGNNGANALRGGGGAGDLLIGLGGNDVYFIVQGSEQLVEGSGGGTDVVYASVSHSLAAGQEIEILSAVSNAATNAMDLSGNGSANTIYGNNGVNTLNGGGGNDILIGFGGNDMFAFTTALGAGNVDAIADFVSGADRIALDDAVFSGLSMGSLPAGAFATGSAAGDADDRIIYNSATGQLFFDADGNGAIAAVLFATLQGAPPIAASDFTVI